MSEFVRHIVAQLPQSWLGRAVWLMLAISAIWVAYVYGVSYGGCRAEGWNGVQCVFLAAGTTWLAVLLQAFNGLIALLSSISP